MNPKAFAKVQAVMEGHNRSKYSKRKVALRGLLTCANDGCQLTGNVQKESMSTTGAPASKGSAAYLASVRSSLTERLGENLKGLQMPPEIVARVIAMLNDDEATAVGRANADRARLETRLIAARNRIDAAYNDKLDGKISEDFWQRKTNDWNTEEQQLKLAIEGIGSTDPASRALSAETCFELANKAYLLYLSQNSTEKPNCSECLFRTFLWGL